MEKKDAELQKQLEDEFLAALEDYSPSVGTDSVTLTIQVPEEVTDYYLKRAGFSSSDPRMYGLRGLS
jgi:hypothetical protein